MNNLFPAMNWPVKPLVSSPGYTELGPNFSTRTRNQNFIFQRTEPSQCGIVVLLGGNSRLKTHSNLFIKKSKPTNRCKKSRITQPNTKLGLSVMQLNVNSHIYDM